MTFTAFHFNCTFISSAVQCTRLPKGFEIVTGFHKYFCTSKPGSLTFRLCVEYLTRTAWQAVAEFVLGHHLYLVVCVRNQVSYRYAGGLPIYQQHSTLIPFLIWHTGDMTQEKNIWKSWNYGKTYINGVWYNYGWSNVTRYQYAIA